MGATELAISIKKYIKQFGGIDVLFPEHTNMGADHFFFSIQKTAFSLLLIVIDSNGKRVFGYSLSG